MTISETIPLSRDRDWTVEQAVAARVRGGGRSRASAAHGGTGPPPPRIMWSKDGATDATILELRAADDVGLLYRVAHALEEAGADIRSARISTLGADVVDAFYLRGDWSSPEARAGIERAVLGAVTPS